MDDCECLLLDSNNQSSSCTQSSNPPISMSTDSSIEHYTKESIMLALKYKKKEYTIVEKKSKANCWSTFGLPAKIIGPNKYEIIKNFASCNSCFQTYSYSSSTTTMSNHKCLILSNKNQSKIEPIPLIKSNSSTPNSDTTTRDRTNSVNCKSLQKQKHLITSAISDWVCSNTRPINIAEDIGLKDLIEQCIKIGFDCGPVSASSILPCRKTISKKIKETANIRRNEIKNVLIKAARERCLTLSPDLWSDRYKKTSYLGCTAHWVDSLWNLYSFELFCLPYRQSNKTGASVLKALEEGLSMYDLVPFMSDIIWVCDGGSNLLKALEKFTVVRCTAHLLNNCLQTIFFQTNALKVKKHILFPDHFYDKSEDEGDVDSNSEEEQNEDGFDDGEINDQQKACVKYNSTISNKKANVVSFISQLSTDAKRILITIIQCKDLVKYVKKMNLNQDLEDRNSSVLLQCTIVRWLSLMNCLESVNKSLVSLEEIFEEKKLNKTRINRISVCLLNKLIDFLKPWEYIMKRIQSSKTPSIHIVTPSICIISSSLETKSNDSKQDKGFAYFRQRAKQIIKQKIQYHPIHLMATFLNPKTRKMKHLSIEQREQCIEYIKQEMLLFDNDNSFKLPTTRKDSQLSINHPIKSINDFYSNAEDNEEDDIDQKAALRTSSHALEIELYIKQGFDKSTNSDESIQEEYNPLSFWKNIHSSYPILSKIAARVFSVPASSAAVEREFSLAGNIITQKRSTLSPDVVNDMVFNHSYKVYQQGHDNRDKFELH